MKPNIDYLWHRKQGKKTATDTWEQHIKTERKKLRKKLMVRIGCKPRTHDMDDEMYETINKMLQSSIRADVEIAMGIIFDSNIKHEHIDKLVADHCNLLLYGPNGWSFYSDGMTRMIVHSNGNVGIGTTIPHVKTLIISGSGGI
jgi:hypothetical protein